MGSSRLMEEVSEQVLHLKPHGHFTWSHKCRTVKDGATNPTDKKLFDSFSVI